MKQIISIKFDKPTMEYIVAQAARLSSSKAGIIRSLITMGIAIDVNKQTWLDVLREQREIE